MGTGRAVNEGGTQIVRLLGAFISLPPAPLSVEKRRAFGGVHTHASIVHSSTDANIFDVRYDVTLFWYRTQYGLFFLNLAWSPCDALGSAFIANTPTARLAGRSANRLLFASTRHTDSSLALQRNTHRRAFCNAGNITIGATQTNTPTVLHEWSLVPHIHRKTPRLYVLCYSHRACSYN